MMASLLQLRRVLPTNYSSSSLILRSVRLLSSSSSVKADVSSVEDLKKKPVKFTTSGAYNVNPGKSFVSTDDDDTPWFQGPVIAFSLACFLIYFTILRYVNYLNGN